jgi:outer membrane lipoprotein-sorting protein
MVRKTLPWCLAALALAAALLSAEEAALTADQVIAKNLEARGGAAKIAAMASAKITGKMMMGPGMEAPFTLEWKRPNKVRMEFTFQGMTGIQAYDGSTAWMLMPFMGQTAPEKMPEQASKEIIDQADFEGVLVNYKDKGHSVEYLGTEEIEGTPAHKLHVTKRNGDEVTYYLDTEANLEIKAKGKREFNGQEMEIDVSFGDYKEVGGLLMPHSIEARPPGAPAGQVITMEKIELNVELPDDRFVMPPAPEKPPAQ